MRPWLSLGRWPRRGLGQERRSEGGRGRGRDCLMVEQGPRRYALAAKPRILSCCSRIAREWRADRGPTEASWRSLARCTASNFKLSLSHLHFLPSFLLFNRP